MAFTQDPLSDGSESSVVQKLSTLVTLQSHETELLVSLEERTDSIDSGCVALDRDTECTSCLIVKKGWFVSESIGPTGSRAIPRIHYPGDIIGLTDLPYDQTVYRAIAKSKAVVCRIPRERFTEILTSFPRLAGILFCVALIEQTQHEDRAALHLRNHATARLALFILQTLDRLKLVNRHLDDQFHCPLTQMDIGDLLGLTDVHISRTFAQLEKLRMIKRQSSFIKVLDRERLCRLTGYTDRFDGLNLDWLPES